MSVRNAVVSRTCSESVPAVDGTASRFSNVLSVCSWIVEPTVSPILAGRAIRRRCRARRR
jgi:hypothetical protein